MMKKACNDSAVSRLTWLGLAVVLIMLISAFVAVPQATAGTYTVDTCGDCHAYSTGTFTDGSARNNPAGAFPGSHQQHVTTYQMACTVCHINNGANFAHRNGNVDINASISGGTYSKGSFSQVNTTSLGRCTNVSCHSNGTPLNGTATFATATWGSPATGACGTCHGVLASSAPTSTHHSKHVGAAAGYQNACGWCHSSTVNMTANSTVQATVTSTTLHVNGIKNVSFETTTNAGANAYGSGQAYSCTNLYCHSQGNTFTSPYTAPNTTALWTLAAGSLNCNSCHGSTVATTTRGNGKPEYANGTPKKNSHAGHFPWNTLQSCQICHSATTTDGVSVTNKANHVKKSYNVGSYTGGGAWNTLANFTYTYNANGSTCNTNQCHAGLNAQWGSTGAGSGSEWNCITCHSSSFKKFLGTGTIRQVVGTTNAADFNMSTIGNGAGSRHLYGASTIVKWDCIICHEEGQATGAPGRVDWQNHNDLGGLIHLRNVDTIDPANSGWAINNKSWTTTDYQSMDEFCVSCHDSNGASAIAVNAANNGLFTGTAAWNTYRAGWKSMAGTFPGRAALAPFNSTDWRSGYLVASTSSVGAGEGRAKITDVKTQFYAGTAGNWATTNYNGNPSQHAVLGTRYGRAWNTWTAAAWSSYFMKKSRANINAMRETALLSCADCHVLDAPGVGGNAHSGTVKYMLSTVTSDGICTKCHSTTAYAAASAISRWNHSYSRGGYNAYGLSNAAGTGSQLACMMCHAGWQIESTVSRQRSYGGIHGSWTTFYPMSTVGSGNLTTYRFFPGTWRKHSYSADNQWGSMTASTCYFGATTDNSGFASCTSHGSATGRTGTTYTPTYTRPVKY